MNCTNRYRDKSGVLHQCKREARDLWRLNTLPGIIVAARCKRCATEEIINVTARGIGEEWEAELAFMTSYET